MKIVLVNYRYFISGGPERYMLNIMSLLEERGHEVIPFSVQNDRNAETPYEKYFLSPIGSGHDVYFSDMQHRTSLKDKYKGFTRMVYSFEAKSCFKKLLQDLKPDLVYILYYQNKISCSIVDAAEEAGIPVVQRISDYSLLAPCSHLFDIRERVICEDCLKKGLYCSIKKKCVRNSKIYSAVKSLSIVVQNKRGMKKKIEKFIFPSAFTMKKFIENGYDEKKLIHIPTFFNDNTLHKDLVIKYEPFALFIGRIDPDKGMMTLLDAFVNTGYSLKIIGFSSEVGYQEMLKAHIAGKEHDIEFLGRMEFDEIQEYLSRCLFTVTPSEWYDNLPNAILESYAMKKCVVATKIGSLTENIIDGETGLLFEYKNVDNLRGKVKYLFDNPYEAMRMGENARKKIDTKFSVKKHIDSLLETFIEVYAKKNNR